MQVGFERRLIQKRKVLRTESENFEQAQLKLNNTQGKTKYQAHSRDRNCMLLAMLTRIIPCIAISGKEKAKDSQSDDDLVCIGVVQKTSTQLACLARCRQDKQPRQRFSLGPPFSRDDENLVNMRQSQNIKQSSFHIYETPRANDLVASA